MLRFHASFINKCGWNRLLMLDDRQVRSRTKRDRSVLSRSPVISYVMSRITPMLKLTRRASRNIRGIDRLRARGCTVDALRMPRVHTQASGYTTPFQGYRPRDRPLFQGALSRLLALQKWHHERDVRYGPSCRIACQSHSRV